MFTYPRALAVAALLAVGLLAQDRPMTVGAPVIVIKLVATPTFGPSGRPEKFVLAIDYGKVDLPPSGLINVTELTSIQHDLLAGTDTVLVGATIENGVMAGGVLYDDREVMEIIEAVAMREYRKAFPGPLPLRKSTELVRRTADESRRAVRAP